jgi:GDP-L-fucose synthase
VAKIAGIKLCQAYRLQHGRDFISVMPTNLYGPGDNFDLQSSHVLPAFIRKIHQAKAGRLPSVEIWGTGTPKREFLHVDDLADACVHLMQTYSDLGHVNVGVGEDIAIRDLAQLIADVIGYDGDFHYDSSKPDGTPRKLLDVGTLTALGWAPRISLRDGITATYQWYLDNVEDA